MFKLIQCQLPPFCEACFSTAKNAREESSDDVETQKRGRVHRGGGVKHLQGHYDKEIEKVDFQFN